MLKVGTGKTTSGRVIAPCHTVVVGLPTLLRDADATGRSAWEWFEAARASVGGTRPASVRRQGRPRRGPAAAADAG
jgi:hypothetical protein